MFESDFITLLAILLVYLNIVVRNILTTIGQGINLKNYFSGFLKSDLKNIIIPKKLSLSENHEMIFKSTINVFRKLIFLRLFFSQKISLLPCPWLLSDGFIVASPINEIKSNQKAL